MSKRRIMLLGGGGQVGQALLAKALPADWELRPYRRGELELTDHNAVRAAFQSFAPDLVVNTAAMTNVDACERDQDAATAANFDVPAILASQCSTRDIPFLHLSTDYVFDGRQNAPYLPAEPMNPVNFYGQSKMMGEEAIRHELPWHVILRVSWVFSALADNMLVKTLKLIDTKDTLRIVSDQAGCPTYAPDIADALIAIASSLLDGGSHAYGTFHYCGSPPCTRFEFVQAIMAAYAPYTDKRPSIQPAASADFPGFAARPAYTALDCVKTEAVYGVPQRSWQDGLRQAMEQLKGRSHE